jgi:hypothetical protein
VRSQAWLTFRCWLRGIDEARKDSVLCSYLVQGGNSSGVGRFFEELELRPSVRRSSVAQVSVPQVA